MLDKHQDAMLGAKLEVERRERVAMKQTEAAPRRVHLTVVPDREEPVGGSPAPKRRFRLPVQFRCR